MEDSRLVWEVRGEGRKRQRYFRCCGVWRNRQKTREHFRAKHRFTFRQCDSAFVNAIALDTLRTRQDRGRHANQTLLEAKTLVRQVMAEAWDEIRLPAEEVHG